MSRTAEAALKRIRFQISRIYLALKFPRFNILFDDILIIELARGHNIHLISDRALCQSR